MKASLNLTSFVPDDFPRQTLRNHAGININKNGKFSINKNGAALTEFKLNDRVVMFQNEEHTSIWFIKKDSSGWPLHDNAAAGLHFSAKFLAFSIFDAFGLDREASFTFYMHEEPIEMNGEQYWILYHDDDSLNEFLESLEEPKVNGDHVNGEERPKGKRGRKPGSKNKKYENAFDGQL